MTSTGLQNKTTAYWQALDREHHVHPFTNQAELAARGVRVITRAEGAHLWDSDGNQLLDGLAGLWSVNVGYGRKELAEAAYRQLLDLPYYNTFFQTTNPPAVELAAKLAEITPATLNRVFFANSGSEANDSVVKIVRYYWNLCSRPEKKTIIGRRYGYHGVTLAAASLSGLAFMHPQADLPLPGFEHVETPYWFDHEGDMEPDALGLHAARVTRGTRVDRRKDLFEITVEPDGAGEVTISLPAGRECSVSGAICTWGPPRKPLTDTPTVTVAGPAEESAPAPLTASFVGVPAEHDGETAFTLRIAFSEPLSWMNGRRLREDVVAAAGGRATKAGRVNRRRDLWKLTVEPDSLADVTVTLAAGAACDTPAAVCTKDGRALSNTISTTVRGPVAVSVADARAEEGTDETIDFAVTLSRAASGTVAVAYATADGTATAGEDYTARKGQLTFDPGETEKTVRVPVLDDVVDEGEETFTLRLLNASGVRIADGVATGTIENSDPLPQAWLARFGRTAAGHVVDAIGERVGGDRAGGTLLMLGGQRVGLDGGRAATRGDKGFLPDSDAADGWLGGEDAPSRVWTLTGRELLLGSSFRLALGEEGGIAAGTC